MSDDAARDEDYFALSQDQNPDQDPPAEEEFDELFPANVPLPEPEPEPLLDPEPLLAPEPQYEPEPEPVAPEPLVDESLYPDLEPIPEEVESLFTEQSAEESAPIATPVSAALAAKLASSVRSPDANKKRKPGQIPPTRSKTNRLPDPRPAKVAQKKVEAEKKPFVAKKSASPEAAPLDPAPGPAPRPSIQKPKRKTTKAKQAKKKAIPKKTPPSKPVPSRPQPVAAADPASHPAPIQQSAAAVAAPQKSNGLLWTVLFAVTWAAIAGCAYYAWSLQKKDSTTSAQPEAAESEVALLKEKIARLEGAQMLADWGNEAIAEGSRFRLEQLDQYYNNPEIQSLKSVANAEIIRVEAYYFTTRKHRDPRPQMPFVSTTDPVKSLAEILIADESKWDVRFRAARMLGEYKDNRKAAVILLEASDTDSNLFVVEECIRAFSRVTNYISRGPFDSKSAKHWWTANRSKFE